MSVGRRSFIIIVVGLTVGQLFRMDLAFLSTFKTFPKIWDRQKLMFDGVKGMIIDDDEEEDI